MKHENYIESDDYYDLGCGWMRNKNYGKAEESFLRAIDCNPRFTHAYVMLARLYARQHLYGDSVRILINATRVDSSFDRLYYLIAKYSFKEGDYKKSLKNIDKAIEMNPSVLYDRVRAVIFRHYSDRTRF